MKLKITEQVQLENIISNYKEIYNKVEEKQEQMKKLEVEINNLLQELKSNRENEKLFGQQLIKVYGSGKFNVQTHEYELDK
jgi:predicted transcriptional regulator